LGKQCPLDFPEYLEACRQVRLADAVMAGWLADIELIFSEKLAAPLREYLFVGRMFEAIS
jgi:hypothetical protein